MKPYRYKKNIQHIHADDWLMTYADMITLLLCFFAVFLSVSAVKKTPEAKIQKPPVVYSVAGTTPAPQASPFKIPEGAKLAQKTESQTTLEMSSGAFFDEGAATLSISGGNALRDLSEALKSEGYKDYIITVESHTDDRLPKSSPFPSNWELSAARASTIVHFFLVEGIAPQRLRAAGYADTFPEAPNRDEHGNPIPENQAKNRRIVIDLQKIK
jgi:chemotaxis protein MotB